MRTARRLILEDDVVDDPSAHIADVAAALASMPMARAITSVQFVEQDEAGAIERLAPSLAARYGLRVVVEGDNGSLVITFERDL